MTTHAYQTQNKFVVHPKLTNGAWMKRIWFRCFIRYLTFLVRIFAVSIPIIPFHHSIAPLMIIQNYEYQPSSSSKYSSAFRCCRTFGSSKLHIYVFFVRYQWTFVSRKFSIFTTTKHPAAATLIEQNNNTKQLRSHRMSNWSKHIVP